MIRAIACIALLCAGCVFSSGSSPDDNENSNNTTGANNTNNPQTNSTTNNGPICGQAICTDDTCGETVTDGCGDSVSCPDCDCLASAVCPVDACGPTEFPDCGTVDCTPLSEDVEARCQEFEDDLGLEPCGEWGEPICGSGTVDCGECGQGECVPVEDGDFCCASTEAFCVDNPGFSGRRDFDDGCGPRQVTCEGEMPTTPKYVEMSAGAAHTCALAENRTDVFCWGLNSGSNSGTSLLGPTFQLSETATPVLAFQSPTGQPIAQLVSGANHVCARIDGGNIHCWGAASQERLGPVLNGNSYSTISIAGARLMAAGRQHTCVRDSDSEVWCWGSNTRNQISTSGAAQASYETPIQVTLEDTTPVQADRVFSGPSADFTCITTLNGNFGCFGATPEGVTSETPTDPEIIVNAAVPAAGVAADSILLFPGVAGPLVYQHGTTLPEVFTTSLLTRPQGLEPPWIRAGALFFCADFDGALYCAGGNGAGQLGQGDLTDTSEFVLVDGVGSEGTGVGVGHVCTLGPQSTGLCWGSNDNGQLGSGNETPSSSPVAVVPPR